MRKISSFERFRLSRKAAACSLVIVLLMAVPAAADTLEFSIGGSGTLTRGSIVRLEVNNLPGVIIHDFQHQVRGDGVARDFHLYFREGNFDDDIGGVPAHQESTAWSQISLVQNVSNDSIALRSFTLNQNEGASGALTLGQGVYSFFFHSLLAEGAEGSGNGVRTVTADPSLHGTIIASDPNLNLIAQASKAGSAFGTSTPNLDRVPGHVLINYTAIPEPSGALLMFFALPIAGLIRRRH